MNCWERLSILLFIVAFCICMVWLVLSSCDDTLVRVAFMELRREWMLGVLMVLSDAVLL